MPKTIVFLDSFKRRCPSESKLVCKAYDFFFENYYNLFYNAIVIPQLKKLSQSADIAIIAMDFSTERRLEKAGIKFKRLSHYELEKIEKQAEEESMRFAESIPNLNPGLKEAVDYKGISLWDMDIIDIWESFMLGIIKNINVISEIIRIEKPKKILIFDSCSEFGKILKNTCATKKIKFSDKTRFISKIKFYTLKIGMRIALKTMGEFISDVRKLRKIRTSVFSDKNFRKSDAILVTNSARVVKLTIPWAKRLRKCSFEVIGLSDSDKKLYTDEKINYTPFSLFIDKKLNEEIDFHEKRLKKLWNKNKRDFVSIKYKGVAINDLISDLFEFLFKIRFPELILHVTITERIIETKKPKLIILYDCWNYFVKTVLNAARKNGVKTLFIQHGVLSDIPLFSKTNVDAMALYGEEMKRILVKRGNEGENMFLTGMIQLDYAAEAISHQKKYQNRVLTKLNLSKDKKTVTFFSQPLLEQELLPALYELFETMKKMPDVQLIVKLHPAESPKQIKKVMEAVGVRATIVKDLSVGEVLSVSDAAVVMTSTTYLDALAFDKPLIVLRPVGEDVLPCVKDGAALGVYRKRQLISALKRVFYDKKTLRKLAVHRKKATTRYAYKIDGQASERIALLIEKLVR